MTNPVIKAPSVSRARQRFRTARCLYATVVGDAALAADVRKMAERSGVSAEQIAGVVQFVGGESPRLNVDGRGQAALILARAASPSPALITAEVVDACQRGDLSAAAVVELVAWLSVLQMVHRLSAFYAPA